MLKNANTKIKQIAPISSVVCLVNVDDRIQSHLVKISESGLGQQFNENV